MWPSTRVSIYEKVSRDESSEASTPTSPSSDGLLPHSEDSFIPKSPNTRAFKLWLLVAFAATAVLLGIDILLQAQALCGRIKYIEAPVPECTVLISVVSHAANISHSSYCVEGFQG